MRYSKRGCLWLACAAALLVGCAHYAGPTRAVRPSTVEGDGWRRVPNAKLVRQRSDGDCGVAASAMVLSRWGIQMSLDEVRADVPEAPEQLRASDVRDSLRAHGLRSYVIEGNISDLEHEIAEGRPVVVGTIKRLSNKESLNHFEVVVAVHAADKLIVTLDPSLGWRKSSYQDFESEWVGSKHTAIVTLPPQETN